MERNPEIWISLLFYVSLYISKMKLYRVYFSFTIGGENEISGKKNNRKESNYKM